MRVRSSVAETAPGEVSEFPAPPPRVTVIVPMLNEERHIEACLDSLLSGSLSPSDMEILVIDGGSTDRSRELVEGVAAVYPTVRLLENPRRIQAAAMNIGLAAARGDVIVRADAHCTFSDQYVQTSIELLETTGAWNVGGICRPVGTTRFGKAVAACRASGFGAGGARYFLATGEEWVDMVNFGAWRRETLHALGGFSESFAVAEDVELSVRIRSAGGRVLLSPRMSVEYGSRETPTSLARQYARYGYWRAKVVIRYPELLRRHRFFSPALTLATLASLVLLAVGSPLGLVVPGAYLVAATVASARGAAGNGPWGLPDMIRAFAIMHYAWGSGFLVGLVRWSSRSSS